ncbi:MAG TPA: hypothetical protein VGP63_04655 [Planctomycetaceae bacterium]|jgi:hypothetical protein|nr:hypothetical protein [Planctomycetaceae bacterium]
MTSQTDYAAIVTAVATSLYTVSFLVAVWIALAQTKEFQASRKLQVLLAIFEEMKSPTLVEQRRYLYQKFPETIEGVDHKQIGEHFRQVEMALTSFSRIGYCLEHGYIEAEPILDNQWALIWRCWRKSKQSIEWARKERCESDYFKSFENLYKLAEEYRIRKGLREPKFF